MAGLASNVGLAGAKYAAGAATNSQALIADAVHSATDVVSDLITWGSIHLSARPVDPSQPYGWGRWDTLGSLTLGVSLLAVGAGTASVSLETLLDALARVEHPPPLPAHLYGLGLATAAVSVGVKELLFRATKNLAQESASPIMMASAYHHRSDSLSSVVAALAVGGAMLHMPLLDPLGGLVVSAMIAHSGVDTVVRAVADLTDRQTAESQSVVDKIKTVAASLATDEGDLRGVHAVRLRRMGAANVADLHVVVGPQLSVTASYVIGEKLRRSVLEQVPEVSDLFIHVDAGEHAFHAPPADFISPAAAQPTDALALAEQAGPMTQFWIEKEARRVVDAVARDEEPMLVGVSHCQVHYLAVDKGVLRITLEVNLVFVPAIKYVVFAELQRVGARVRKALLAEVRCVSEVDVHVEIKCA